MITIKKLKNKKSKLEKARQEENDIIDKYSTNYIQWVKACNKVNRLKREYNSLVTTWNYKHGCTGIGAIIIK